MLARDIRACPPGQAQYTIWCDERGFVIEDGVVLRHGADEFLLTAAEPNFAYFPDRVGRAGVEIEEVSRDIGSLAIQGPRSRDLLAQLVPRSSELALLRPHAPARSATRPVTVIRTGYTGDLGYEIWVDEPGRRSTSGNALGFEPTGTACCRSARRALLMLRIEAGLLLLDVDFDSSRFA